MKKACILLIALLLVASCANDVREDSGDIPTKYPIKTSLDAKAKEKAEQEFSKYFTKCGDYYYSYFYELVITQILSKEVYQIKLREKVRAIRFG